MASRNVRITEATNSLVDSYVTLFNEKGYHGLADSLEHFVKSEHDYRHDVMMKNIGWGKDWICELWEEYQHAVRQRAESLNREP